MSNHMPPRGWFRSWPRRTGFDSNPMRRTTDRIQAITRAALLVVFLAGAPTAAVGISHALYVSGLQAGRAQAATEHPVPAAVLRMTPLVTGWSRARPSPPPYSVRWTSPAGTSATGPLTRTAGGVPGGPLAG